MIGRHVSGMTLQEIERELAEYGRIPFEQRTLVDTYRMDELSDAASRIRRGLRRPWWKR